MSWIPKYITEGLFSPLIPAGVTTGLIENCQNYGNLNTIGGRLLGNYSRSSTDSSGAVSWNGSYGVNFNNRLLSIMGNDADSGGVIRNDVDLVEFEIEPPDGAQYYKQTLAVIGMISTNAKQHDTQVIDSTTYELDWYYGEITMLKLVRREYSTPYSAYTSEDLITLTLAQALYINLTPNIWIRGGTQFLTRGLFTMGEGVYNGTSYFCFAFYTERTQKSNINADENINRGAQIIGLPLSTLEEKFGGSFIPEEKDDPNEEDDPPGPGEGGGGGGEGEHDLPNEEIPVPSLPAGGTPGWLKLYCMDHTDINDFGTELVDPTPMQMLKQYFSDPLDAIIGITYIACLPGGIRYQYTPSIHGTPGYNWSRSFTVCGRYSKVDCGSISIPVYWDSSFDFDPYTKFFIWLPYIGYKQLNADEIMGSSIYVEYHIDCMTGSCIAFISRGATSLDIYGPVQKQVIAQYQGNCGIQVPIGRTSHDAAVGAAIQLAATGIGMAAGAAAGAAGLVNSSNMTQAQLGRQIESATMLGVEGQKTQVFRSGSVGMSAGYLGIQKPYIIRQIPRQDLPSNYKMLNGYPCNKGGTLGDFAGTGFTTVESIQLNNIPALEDERREILDWLSKGVIL